MNHLFSAVRKRSDYWATPVFGSSAYDTVGRYLSQLGDLLQLYGFVGKGQSVLAT